MKAGFRGLTKEADRQRWGTPNEIMMVLREEGSRVIEAERDTGSC